MPTKKPINFQQEMQSSQQFLKKLQSIKKSSQDIKQKNKLTQHKNFWVKEFNYLSRLQRDLDSEITNYFDVFDRYFQSDIEQRQLFTQTPYKNYSQLRQHIEQNLQQFEAETFKQVQSLPILAQKVTKSPKQIKKSDILQILNDIQHLLNNVAQQNTLMEEQLATKQAQTEKKIIEENVSQIQESELLQLNNLKSLSPKIKGFDMEKQTIAKLRQSESNLLQYLQLFNHQLSQDEIYQVLNQFNHANRLLEQTFQLEKEKLQLDYEDALKIDPSLINNSQNFNKITHIYSTYIGRGKSIQLYYERLTIQFPKWQKKTLEIITDYIQARIYKEKKLSALKRNYLKQKQQLFNKVDKQIHIRIENKIQKAKKKAQQLQRKQEKLKLQKQLQILRADYNKRKQQQQKIKKQSQAAIKQAQRKKQALRKLYLDQLSKKAEQVHHIKSQKIIEQQHALQSAKQKQQQQRRKAIQQNKPKVQMRQSIQRKKIQKKVQQRQYKQKLPQMQAERIKHAIESYNFRPKVEFDKERLNKPTQALIKRKQTVMDKADKVELSKMTGYSVNQLMSDMRFKVNMALQEAGLSNTDYARELLVSMSKRPN